VLGRVESREKRRPEGASCRSEIGNRNPIRPIWTFLARLDSTRLDWKRPIGEADCGNWNCELPIGSGQCASCELQFGLCSLGLAVGRSEWKLEELWRGGFGEAKEKERPTSELNASVGAHLANFWPAAHLALAAARLLLQETERGPFFGRPQRSLAGRASLDCSAKREEFFPPARGRKEARAAQTGELPAPKGRPLFGAHTSAHLSSSAELEKRREESRASVRPPLLSPLKRRLGKTMAPR